MTRSKVNRIAVPSFFFVAGVCSTLLFWWEDLENYDRACLVIMTASSWMGGIAGVVEDFMFE